MTIVRVADIPPDELSLLPVTDLGRQIREDGHRPGPPSSRAHETEATSARPGRALNARVRAAGLLPAAVDSFVTDWQMQNELHPGARRRLDWEDIDEEPFDDDDFDDSEDDDTDDETDGRYTSGRFANVP